MADSYWAKPDPPSSDVNKQNSTRWWCTDEFSEEDQGTGQSPHPLSSFLSNASNACPHLLEVAMCV